MAIIYKNEYLTTLQERLSDKDKVFDFCNVEFTDTQVIHNPYLTAATANTGTRGTAYTPEAVETTDDTITINTYKITAQYIDRADLAQKTFSGWMALAEDQAQSLREAIETAMFANHAEYTNFDNASIGGGAGNITVTESNVEDIITGVLREIREAKGGSLLERNGAAIFWRPADYEMVEKVRAATGFSAADDVIINGVKVGFKFHGVENYYSNFMTSGHLLGGVKKALHLGICKSTYGQIYEIEDPVVSGGQISGIGINSRADFKFKAWSRMVPVLFDILVA